MSITAVPLQPTPQGVMTKLWVGMVACVVLAGGLAVYGTQAQAVGGTCGAQAFVPATHGATPPITTATGLRFQTVKKGEGNKPSDADVALIGYKGSLSNGIVFDSNERAPLPVAAVVPGFSEALKLMQRGGSYRMCIPAKLGYGEKVPPGGPIPPNSILLFSVNMLDFKSRAEIEAMQQQMRQMQGQHPEMGGPPQGQMPQGQLPQN